MSKRNTLKIIFIILIIMFSITSMVWIYQNILKKSYFSYVGACRPDGAEILKDSGLVEVGSANFIPIDTNLSDFDPSSPPSNEDLNFTELKCVISLSSLDKGLLRHELCHCAQFERKDIFLCSQPLGVFINEMECYIIEETPWAYIREVNKFINETIIK